MSKLPAAFAVLLIMVSCEKQPGPDAHIPRVKQLKVTSLPNMNDYEHIDINYDQLHRVTKMFVYSGDSGRVVPAGDSMVTVMFSYAGEGILPTTIDHIQHFNGQHLRHYLIYDKEMRLARDSVYNVDLNSALVTRYSYSGPDMFLRKVTPYGFEYDTIRRKNGNVISHNSRKQFIYTKTNYEYDSKMNPLHLMNVADIFFVIQEDVNAFWSVWSPVTNNNIIRTTTHDSGGGYWEYTAQYYYNSDGLVEGRKLWGTNGLPFDSLTYKY